MSKYFYWALALFAVWYVYQAIPNDYDRPPQKVQVTERERAREAALVAKWNRKLQDEEDYHSAMRMARPGYVCDVRVDKGCRK